MRNNFFYISVVILSALLGFGLGGMSVYWKVLNYDFFDFKLKDILEIFITLVVALFVSSYISQKDNKVFKQKELIAELLKDFQLKLNVLHEVGSNHMMQPVKAQENTILFYTRQLSSSLGLINSFQKKYEIRALSNIDGLAVHKFHEYKDALTNNPFGQNKPYPAGSMATFNKKYIELVELIGDCRMDLYL